LTPEGSTHSSMIKEGLCLIPRQERSQVRQIDTGRRKKTSATCRSSVSIQRKALAKRHPALDAPHSPNRKESHTNRAGPLSHKWHAQSMEVLACLDMPPQGNRSARRGAEGMYAEPDRVNRH